MKKTIILVMLISIMFLFSSCDAMLEGFFPKATGADRGEDANNTIEVGVEIGWDLYDSMEFRDCYSPLIIQLEWHDGAQYVPFEQRHFWCHWESYIYEMFEWLPPGDFRVVIFFDRNADYVPNMGDNSSLGWDPATGFNYIPVGGGSWYRFDAYIDTFSYEVTSP